METKHTSTKWVLTNDGEANFYGIATENDWLMRVQQNGKLSVTEQEANMKLIIEAPELLDCLVLARQFCISRGMDIESDFFIRMTGAIKNAK